MRNANPRPADEAEETGLGASVFRFLKHETHREMRWSVSRNETPAKIVFRFCCLRQAPKGRMFHYRRVSTLALQVVSGVKRLSR